MFVAFRKAGRRVKVYLAESRRQDGKPRQETVAYLGSIEARHLGPQFDEAREAASVKARLAFWRAVFPKLDALANRVGGTEAVADLRFAIYPRIPWPGLAERDRVDRAAPVAAALVNRGILLAYAEMCEQDIARMTEKIAKLRAQAKQTREGASQWQAEAEHRRRRVAG
jgi:hypothetical protein